MQQPTITQRMTSEFVGTAFLLAAVVGSGVMAERLSAGNEALALLCNALPTGAMLVVLITMLNPISGAHFNPAVTAAFAVRGDISMTDAAGYVVAQVSGAIVGVWAAHAMFELPLFQHALKARGSFGLGFSECVATFGLVLTVLMTARVKQSAVPISVGLYVMAAYWFTASTSFANPAVTLARAFSNTFTGIQLADVPLFVAAQLLGTVAALAVARLLSTERAVGDNERVSR